MPLTPVADAQDTEEYLAVVYSSRKEIPSMKGEGGFQAFNNAFSDIKERVKNNIGCDNINSNNSSETGEHLEKVCFKKGGMSTKGKRSYRKRQLSDD